MEPTVRAQSNEVVVRIGKVPVLSPGAHHSVELEVSLAPGQGAPLLVTPTIEGSAVEVVRGRLLRSDAVDPQASPLRFRLPIVANSPGTSVLRVEVRGFACAQRCQPVQGSASLVLRVSST